MENRESTEFGFKDVTPAEKTQGVIDVFDNVASKYDIMNDVMSVGIHRLWKNEMIRMIRPRATTAGRPMRYLDVAGGTGDIAFRLRQKIGADADITLCDLNHAMLSVGRDRAINKGFIDDFDWITGNAEALPFPDNSFDVYTIAFGLRNVTHIDTALREAKRVLRPNGRFFCLEFSRVEPKMLRTLYDAYSFNLIPQFGKLIAQDYDSYAYLVESIRKFPSQRKLVERIKNSGFNHVKYRNMSMGVVSIHQGTVTD